jgi:hypothetical protein
VFTIAAYSNDNIGEVKEKIEHMKSIPYDKQRLIYAGRTFNNAVTLSSLNLGEQATRGKTVHMALELIGGAKKGVKKLTKQEKLAALRATTLYRSQASPGIDQLLAPLSAPNFIAASIQNMAPDTVIALNDALNSLKQVREDTLTTTITPFFVPLVTQWKQQIAVLENNLSVAESAVGTVFCDSYYATVGFDYDSFFQAVQDRVALIEAERLRAQIQAETIAAMQGPPAAAAAAAPMDDA